MDNWESTIQIGGDTLSISRLEKEIILSTHDGKQIIATFDRWRRIARLVLAETEEAE